MWYSQEEYDYGHHKGVIIIIMLIMMMMMTQQPNILFHIKRIKYYKCFPRHHPQFLCNYYLYHFLSTAQIKILYYLWTNQPTNNYILMDAKISKDHWNELSFYCFMFVINLSVIVLNKNHWTFKTFYWNFIALNVIPIFLNKLLFSPFFLRLGLFYIQIFLII